MARTLAGSFDQMPSEEVYPGVRRWRFDAEGATVTRYAFDAGASFPRHHHAQEQITLVEDGEAQFTVEGTVHAMRAGDWTVVSAGVEHGLHAGPGGARILAIVVPGREQGDAYTVVGDGPP